MNAATEAIARAGFAAVDMEFFAADHDPPAEVCRRKVLAADVYVGIIGLRYGSVVGDQPDSSYTELEYTTAAGAAMPRFVFLLDEDAPGIHRLDRRTLRGLAADRRSGEPAPPVRLRDHGLPAGTRAPQ